ncbi:Semaphorin-2A precursor, putative [Pediculus humanus corporis]|uniref:Semaphorin-2A n=1 Tax=Pediculus humanus subsp. corporis TaxID=121224 RepID=E0VMC9_PEDHC|nr:Semaphorin-2A precursor, putative [Pediculus humanus corporis]EEB14535.1 Semaphorin-2A precursor, putative [Pediculus humanus corporis]
MDEVVIHQCFIENVNAIIHLFGSIQEFTCGKLYYRTFYLDEKRNSLYVGAMDKLFKLKLNSISHSSCERDSLSLEPSDVGNCVSKGKSEYFDCRNHVRVIQAIGDGSRFYVCGTNAHNPKDWVIYGNLTRLPRHEYVPGIGTGIAKCPYDPSDNSTAVWVEEGNPGNLPGLYSGTNAEFTKADTVIFRTDLHNTTTGRKEFNFKRTLKYDSKWLDKPNFVGSYDVGEYVLFFFRETAVEYINCGKSIYSRVARVCKRDTGGKNILSQNWATYLKARLNCSIPGEFPFYFNEIQNVYKIPGDNTKFYGVFTTNMNGLMGSAICSYDIKDIIKAFKGRFKEQATSSSAWLPVLSNKVPEPRPGECVNNTETLPDTVLNFIRSHPLMDEAVRHENDRPVFYKRDILFTHVVVDKIKIDSLVDQSEYTLFYAATSEGKVYKIVQWLNGGDKFSALLDIFDATPNEPIRAMEISNSHKAIYVATDFRVRQLNLIVCNNYDSCIRCVRDPYCGWDKDTKSCRPFNFGLLQDVSNTSVGICDSSTLKKKVVATWGQSIHLGCFPKGAEALHSYASAWYHYSKEKGKYQIVFRRDKYIETNEHGLVIIGVSELDAGRYDFWLNGALLCSYNITIDAFRCTSPKKSYDYQKIYSDWCHEFEKYKLAMKSWERKHEQCVSRMNDSHQNSLSNEIQTLKTPFIG